MRGGMWIRARRGREVYARRREAGLSLFGALLALALLGMMVAGGAVFLETRALEERARLGGVAVAGVVASERKFCNEPVYRVAGNASGDNAR